MVLGLRRAALLRLALLRRDELGEPEVARLEPPAEARAAAAVVVHAPDLALLVLERDERRVGDVDGLRVHRARRFLQDGGLLLLELGQVRLGFLPGRPRRPPGDERHGLFCQVDGVGRGRRRAGDRRDRHLLDGRTRRPDVAHELLLLHKAAQDLREAG